MYVSAGGLWAVISTDVLQFVILTAAVIIVVPLSFDKINGVTALIEQVPDTFYNLLNDEYTFGFLGICTAIYLRQNTKRFPKSRLFVWSPIHNQSSAMDASTNGLQSI